MEAQLPPLRDVAMRFGVDLFKRDDRDSKWTKPRGRTRRGSKADAFFNVSDVRVDDRSSTTSFRSRSSFIHDNIDVHE
jgi:hypothetical protein